MNVYKNTKFVLQIPTWVGSFYSCQDCIFL